jgi:DNA (cytosine-5)-methyltransferase 1
MIRLAEFCAGVGGIRLGFEKASSDFVTVYANDIDGKCKETYDLNHPSCCLNVGNVKDIDIDSLPDFDILLSGFPCVAFSIAGKRLGFEDERGNIFFYLLDIISKKKPQCIFLENVKNLERHNKGNTFSVIKTALEDKGYTLKYQVMNSCEYGNIPQNRERIYIVGFYNPEQAESFKFPKPIPLTKNMMDVLESDIPDKYYYENSKIYDKIKDDIVKHISTDTVYQYRRHYVRENKSGLCPTLTANMGTGGHNVPLILDDNGIRKLTPRECFNLQAFSKKFKLPQIADCNLYKQAGNSVTVSVIKRIAKQLYKTFDTIKI